MSLLRIRAPLGAAPARCEWALLEGRQSTAGEGTLAQLPRGTQRVQLLVPAAQALITRAILPKGAQRRAGPVLAFAVEEASAAEPEANQVSWLGALEGEAAGGICAACSTAMSARRRSRSRRPIVCCSRSS